MKLVKKLVGMAALCSFTWSCNNSTEYFVPAVVVQKNHDWIGTTEGLVCTRAKNVEGTSLCAHIQAHTVTYSGPSLTELFEGEEVWMGIARNGNMSEIRLVKPTNLPIKEKPDAL